jgi:hypothetical protein
MAYAETFLIVYVELDEGVLADSESHLNASNWGLEVRMVQLLTKSTRSLLMMMQIFTSLTDDDAPSFL